MLSTWSVEGSDKIGWLNELPTNSNKWEWEGEEGGNTYNCPPMKDAQEKREKMDWCRKIWP